ncbi:MAG: rod shape-determining protein MreD [Bacteroidia bacterium]
MNLILGYFVQFIFLIFMQTFVFEKIYLTTYCVPFFYLMVILTLPVFMNKYFVLILSFLVGWILDMFYHTGGIHAAATTIVGYLRFYWLKIIEPSDRYEENQLPVASMMGRDWFIKYIIPMIFIHHLFLFTLESFNIRFIFDILIRSILSTIVSVILIYFFHLIFFRPKSK